MKTLVVILSWLSVFFYYNWRQPFFGSCNNRIGPEILFVMMFLGAFMATLWAITEEINKE